MLDAKRRYREKILAANQFHKKFKVETTASVGDDNIIYVWADGSIVEKCVYLPFKYEFIDSYIIRLVYSDGNKYTFPTYYV